MSYRFETLQVHAGQEQPDPATGARAVPIYSSTSFVFGDCDSAEARFALKESGNIYGRLTNPTNDAFERRIAALEGGKAALSLASGAAAVTYAVQNILRAGDRLVCSADVYGGTYNLFAHTLAEFGIQTDFCENTPEAYERAMKDNTKAIFIETLGNPHSSVADVEKISEIAHRHGVPLIADNTFATPYLFRPLEHGADIVVHSATKFIGGHGAALGGVVVDGGKFDWNNGNFPALSRPNPSYHGAVFTDAAGDLAYIVKMRAALLRDTGATLSPFHTFLFLQGLESLSLRVERHVGNALKVVDFLRSRREVAFVDHPANPERRDNALYRKYFPQGGASIFTFEMAGGGKKARKFIDSLKLFSLLANVADSKSLVIHPASTTHSQMNEKERRAAGITDATVRLSVGIEHIDDILADLDAAFGAISRA